MTSPDLPNPQVGRPLPAEAGAPTAPKACGQCSLCCKLLEIAELEKPMGVWCRHFVKGRGCGVYADRPPACQDYQCAWTWAPLLDDRWRPDRAGFLIHPVQAASELEIVADPSRPAAWRREPYYSQIKTWSDPANTSVSVVRVRIGDRVLVVFPETEIDLGLSNGRTGIRCGYERKGGKLQPYARFSDGDEA